MSGGFLARGVFVQGVFVRGFMSGGFCPGGFCPDTSRQNSSYIIDGNALIQAQAGIPATFGELADVIFDQLPKTERVDFVTDRYIPCSIKENE